MESTAFEVSGGITLCHIRSLMNGRVRTVSVAANGCIETWLSGPGLGADYLRNHGVVFSAGQIVMQAGEGDEYCQQMLMIYFDRLARALAGVINILDPDVIVLGGGLSNITYLYQHLPLLWPPHVFSDHVHTQLLPPKHGDSSGVRGAGMAVGVGDEDCTYWFAGV